RTTRPRKASTPLAISARVTLTGLPFRGISLIGSQLLRAAFRCGGRLFERSAQAGAAAVSGRFDENRRDRLSAGAAMMPPTEEARAADVSRLFRAEVLEARRAKAGAIVLVSPVSCRLLGAVGVAAAAALVAFLALGTYTRHVTLAGQLVPERGVIAVLAPQPGTVVQSRVAEGRRVEPGDVLFVISGERTSALGETHALIGERLAARRRSLREQLDELRALELSEAAALASRARALETELARVAVTIDAQSARIALAEETAQRYAELRAEGFVSAEQLVARREALLDQRARLAGLERERAQLERQRAEAGGELDDLP